MSAVHISAIAKPDETDSRAIAKTRSGKIRRTKEIATAKPDRDTTTLADF